jgi:hypothetical protein
MTIHSHQPADQEDDLVGTEVTVVDVAETVTDKTAKDGCDTLTGDSSVSASCLTW